MIKQNIHCLFWVCVALLLLSIIVTWLSPKDVTSDAWAYHYYSGSQLFESRLNIDYFAASLQGYFNPLVHVPFAAMVKAEWSDRVIATVLACYSATALILLAIFYKIILQLDEWQLLAAVVLSISSILVWTCTGTSTPDLFLQVPVLAGLLCLFGARKAQCNKWLILAGVFLGVALGLKLSAIIYAPGVGALLLYWWYKKYISWQWVLVVAAAVILGFLLSYGWWGLQLYQRFDNPFFPFFNQWFHSSDYTSEVVGDRRFLSWNMFEQGLLPFRMALSDMFVYVEIIAPDIRPSIFLVLCVVALVRYGFIKTSLFKPLEAEFLWFVFISLYTWVFMSGNGRYAISILLFLGAAIFILLRHLLPSAAFRVAVALVIMLQFTIVLGAGFSDGTFRLGRGEWGGSWFNMNFDGVIRKDNQLILTDTRNPLSVLVREIGAHSSLVNVGGVVNALKNNSTIQAKIRHYDGRILGVTEALEPALMLNTAWMNEFYFKRFGRFGLGLGDKTRCELISMRGKDNEMRRALSVCPLIRDDLSEQRYIASTQKANEFYRFIEAACAEVFSPTNSAVEMLSEGAIHKYYSNYDMDVVIGKRGDVIAKRMFYMSGFSIGNLTDLDTVSISQWRQRYCPLVKKDGRIGHE